MGARPESFAKDLVLSYVKAPKLDRKAVRYVSDHFAREWSLQGAYEEEEAQP